jgi:hypothetical protein
MESSNKELRSAEAELSQKLDSYLYSMKSSNRGLLSAASRMELQLSQLKPKKKPKTINPVPA